jgi:secreted trypsin-like serine protease
LSNDRDFLYLSGLAECNVRRLSEVNKIIGGETTKLIDFPWQTSLQVKHLPSHVCGAALIADQWVLTAAHCFRRSSDPNYWKVKLGKYNLTQFDSNGRDFYISKVSIRSHFSFKILIQLLFSFYQNFMRIFRYLFTRTIRVSVK